MPKNEKRKNHTQKQKKHIFGRFSTKSQIHGETRSNSSKEAT